MDSFSNKKRYSHTNTQKVTLTPNSNTKPVTLDHTYSRSLQQFVDRAYHINVKEQKPFLFKDYPNLSHTNFRRIIRKLGKDVVRVGNGRPQLYKLRGIKLPGDTRKITLEPMGAQEEHFVELISKLKEQPPRIHDIKIRIDNSELHKELLQKGSSKDKHNHSIKINFEGIDNNVTTKILVYPNTIQVDIGCTYRPLIYNIDTVWYLHEHLAKISYHLTGLSGVILPTVNNWIITHWHFGKDGTTAYNGQSFHFTIEDVNTGLIRFYSKLMENGERIPRLEQIQTPQNSIEDEMKRAMFSGLSN
ncbi:MAG: hypothetical protein NPMRTH1_270030 [Nitrosopumilales archaeon]|nr:MAG: hypothetical protein NPMRTH1_270030 [Nitrosopumilales archaeon]